MVEDVTTSGKSIDETYPKVKAAADVEIKGLIVSLNRMEVGKGGVTTAQKEIEAKYGFPVASIVSMAEVVETLYNHEIDGKVVIDDEHLDNLTFNFKGATRKSAPFRFTSPCLKCDPLAGVAKTSALPW